MKNPALLLMIATIALLSACKKNSESPNFTNLTSITWASDSLLANGNVADGSGQMLEKFKGDAIFNKDGSGKFGQYPGTWRFSNNETKLVIDSDSIMVTLTANIVTLTSQALKITTHYPNVYDPFSPIDIRMTFKAK